MKITNVRAAGYSILVEMLTQQESFNTSITLTKDESPQARIINLGPQLDDSKLGFKPGDRVVVQGTYVPVPNPTDSGRKWGIVEAHNIKAILEEEETEGLVMAQCCLGKKKK